MKQRDVGMSTNFQKQFLIPGAVPVFKMANVFPLHVIYEWEPSHVSATNSSLKWDKKTFFAVITYFPIECCPSI